MYMRIMHLYMYIHILVIHNEYIHVYHGTTSIYMYFIVHVYIFIAHVFLVVDNYFHIPCIYIVSI